MANEDNFIVAIELGSSKVTGIAGRKHPDGAIQVLAFAQEPSTAFMRKGRINNVSKMQQCVKNIKEKLEQKLQMNIKSMYVGIGGMGMHTVANTIVRRFDSKMEITQDMVDTMSDENRSAATPDRDILDVAPQEFRLGTQLTGDPVGILSDSIEGHYLNIVASSQVREGIRKCFHAAKVNIPELPITLLAMADSMLTEPERRSGCVFVDMGSETTSIAVYKNNLLRHLAIIPLGGANINRDICSLSIEDDEAEQLKLRYGSALSESSDEEQKGIQLHDGRTISHEEFTGLVEARVEEIILNVKNQIELSHYDQNQLIGGLIITGGAANMRGIDKAFTQLTGFEKIRFVRNIKMQLRTSGYPDFNKNGDCNAALALIDKGGMNCCGGELKPDDTLFDEPTSDNEQPIHDATTAPVPAAAAVPATEATAPAEPTVAPEPEEKKPKGKSTIRKGFEKFGKFLGNLVKEEDDER